MQWPETDVRVLAATGICHEFYHEFYHEFGFCPLNRIFAWSYASQGEDESCTTVKIKEGHE